MNIYTGLLFNQGHIQDPELARSLAQVPQPQDMPPPAGAAPARRTPGRRLPGVRRGQGWVELQAALLSAFR